MAKPIKLSASDVARFWSKVDIRGENECWLWKAGTSPRGYGKFQVDGGNRNAHRVAWIIANGRNPRDDCDIAHAPVVCHNPSCCNPKHLSEKTKQENQLDRIQDGTDSRGERNPSAKLTRDKVERVPILRALGLSQAVVGKLLGVNQTQISRIERKIKWK